MTKELARVHAKNEELNVLNKELQKKAEEQPKYPETNPITDDLTEEKMEQRIKEASEKTEQIYQTQLKTLQDKMTQFEHEVAEKDAELLKNEESML